MNFDAKIPSGPVPEMWSTYRKDMKMLAPNNKRK